MTDRRDHHLQIGQFAELVGLSVPQLRRYDRLQLLTPEGRTAAGYRYYTSGQTGTGRVISLLRSIDMPIADIRQVLGGAGEPQRQALLRDHRVRLEDRLDEVRRLLDAVDRMTTEGDDHMTATVEPTMWLHLMPHLPVSDVAASVSYYQEAMGFQLAWQTSDGSLSALASGAIEAVLLVPWSGSGPPPAQSAYVYVDDPDALCDEYEQAGATIIDAVATRPHGMRDFVVADPDGHRFVLGRADEDALRSSAAYYGLDPDEISPNPEWLRDRGT